MSIKEILSTKSIQSKPIQRVGNIFLIPVTHHELEGVCVSLYREHGLSIKTVIATDERKRHNSFRIFYAFGQSQSNNFVAPYIEVGESQTFPSLVSKIHELSLYEREIQTFFGLKPEGHPDLRPLILHENWPLNEFPLHKDFEWTKRPPWTEGVYNFHKIEGEGVYEIPVGPVHAGIIEPGHFRFSVIGEEIIALEPKLGYVHKGIEKLFEVLPSDQKLKLSERISGDSSFSHSLAFCQALEVLAEAEAPFRARYLRVIYAELERIANHLGDIAFIMLDTAFNFGGSQCTRLREIVIEWNEKLTGSRFLRGVNIIGGVRKDIETEQAKELGIALERLKKDFLEVIYVAEETQSLLNRLKGTGRLDKKVAMDHGAVGVAARAAGIGRDARIEHPYAAYSAMPVKIVLEGEGDVYARFEVRVKEVANSIEIILEALKNLPRGDVTVSVQGFKRDSIAIGIVEGWRGEIAHAVATDEKGEISRVKVRDPSFLNWSLLPYVVTNDVVPDFPLINKSFNLSYSGNDL